MLVAVLAHVFWIVTISVFCRSRQRNYSVGASLTGVGYAGEAVRVPRAGERKVQDVPQGQP